MKIYSRWDSSKVVFEYTAATLRETVIAAVDSGANLGGADLRGADLRGANLGGADLGDADLGDANLRGADLGDADLRGANLGGADLRGADLRGAYLRGAYLGGAYFGGAKEDFIAVLNAAPKEVAGLREALVSGRVDGSVYEGDCACLVGTIAKLKGCNYAKIEGLAPDSSRPAERLFLAIQKGDTPETNPIVKLAVEWIDEYQPVAK